VTATSNVCHLFVLRIISIEPTEFDMDPKGQSIRSMSCSADTHLQLFLSALTQAPRSNCQDNSGSLTWRRLTFWSLTRSAGACLRHHGSRFWIVREPNAWYVSSVWSERSICEQWIRSTRVGAKHYNGFTGDGLGYVEVLVRFVKLRPTASFYDPALCPGEGELTFGFSELVAHLAGSWRCTDDHSDLRQNHDSGLLVLMHISLAAFSPSAGSGNIW